MKALLTGLVVFSLSIGAFAIDESATLKYLLMDSLVHFKAKKKDVASKLRGIKILEDMDNLSRSHKLGLEKSKTLHLCRKKTYDMLFNISKMYNDKDALSSAFLTRRDLKLEGDDLLSIYDFFIQPYLEYLNYKTEYLTAQVNGSSFRTNEDMPFYIGELNVDGYCQKQADLKHYGENDEYPEMELELPPSIIVNDVKRSKQKIIEREIQFVKEFETTTRAK